MNGNLFPQFAEERDKALSSYSAFRDYLKARRHDGDVEEVLSPAAVLVNWRGIVENMWDMARELGGEKHLPPALPRIDSEAAAQSAIDQLLTWTWQAEGKPAGGASPLDKDGEEVLKIARSKQSADDRMRSICGLDKRYLAWDSQRWSSLLGVSAAAIRKTQFWRVDRKRIPK